MRSILIFFIVGCVLSGCTRFKEVHYFRDEAGSPDNYYRLEVKGHTLMTSARYVSGYFDEEAVNQYFSEFKQPEKGKFGVADSDSSKTADIEPLSGSRDGQQLVMILSSNSDAVASQLGSYTENQKTLDALVQLVNRDRILSAAEAKSNLVVQQTRGKILADLGDKLIAGMNDEASQPTVAASLLQYVNAIAAELGNERPFSNFEDANNWLIHNRGRLLNDD